MGIWENESGRLSTIQTTQRSRNTKQVGNSSALFQFFPVFPIDFIEISTLRCGFFYHH